MFALTRVAVKPDGAFGVLSQDGEPVCLTLERTYDQAGGAQLVKIPSSVYLCKSRFYYRGGYDSYEVTGVPGHSLLLFHKGNVEGDSEGCILLGRRFGSLHGKPAILESGLAFDEFMRRTQGRPDFQLEVKEIK